MRSSGACWVKVMSTAKVSISCEQADELMDSQFGAAGEVPEAAAAHLRECTRCRELYAWILSGADSGPSGVEVNVSERISANLKPVKPLPPTSVLAGRFVGVFALLVVLLIVLLGASGPENMSLPQLLVIAAVLGASAIFLSLSLSWQMVPGKHQRIPAPLLIGAFALGFVIVVATMFPWENVADLFGLGWGCTRAGLLMAIPAAAVLTFLATRGAPLSFGLLGACLGATSGLLALTVLQLHCDNQHAGHLLLWHGGVVLLCTTGGYALGRIAELVAARRPGSFD
jgi:hypothetical protein